jgi:hypothetical protein
MPIVDLVNEQPLEKQQIFRSFFRNLLRHFVSIRLLTPGPFCLADVGRRFAALTD